MKNNSKEVVLTFDLPNFNRKDIDVKISKNSISIKAKKKNKNEIQKKDFYHREMSQRIFNYATTLPEINPKKTKINFSKGILKITAPKK